MFAHLSARIIQVSKKVGWMCGCIAAITTMALIAITVCDIFLRFVFNKPINGTFELTEYAMIIIVFMAIPWATTRNVHVRVDLLTGKFSAKKQTIIYAISCFLSMIITFLFGWYTYPEILYAYDIQFKSDMLDIPTYPFYIIIMIGFFLLLFTLLAVFLEYINDAVAK
jgi:TRAP-type C4-dicarboxylate transport system permease small subunit